MSIQNDPSALSQQFNMQEQANQAGQDQAFDAAMKAQTDSVQMQQQMNSPVQQVRNHQVDAMLQHGMGSQPAPSQAHLVHADNVIAQKPNFDPHSQGTSSQVPHQAPHVDPSQITNFLKKVYKTASDAMALLLGRFVPGVHDEGVVQDQAKHSRERGS